jgi:large subunit ribosomal protein L22
MMKQTAKLNHLRIAPRKVRLIASLMKGMTVNEAEAHLTMHRQRASKPLLKLLRSAVANAKNNAKMDTDKMFIETFRVDGASMLKRMLPRARGMATPIQKKMSHVTLVLAEQEKPKENRFKIVIKKKAKTAAQAKRAEKKKTEGEEEQTSSTSRKPGFFRRNFSRKSGTA